jgi:polyisoprenyl-phosphate glycosyltransferase
MQPARAETATVSVVVPAFNEANHVDSLTALMREIAAAETTLRFELVVVDDGSTDGTAQALVRSSPESYDLQVVELSRNFGSHAAISAGFQRCIGDCAIVLGADGQEPASLVSDLIHKWRDGYQVVWGIRRSRARKGLRDIASRLFSSLFARYTALETYPTEGPSGVLVDGAVLGHLNAMGELNRNVLALVAWLGYQQTSVHYDQLSRQHGRSKWTTKKMVKLAVDSLIQFSSAPLRFCTFAGMGAALLGALYALLLVVRELQGVSTPSGWPTLLVVVLLLGGTQLLVIGVLGEYLWRAVEESRRRPLYVVKDHFRSSRQESGGPQR